MCQPSRTVLNEWCNQPTSFAMCDPSTKHASYSLRIRSLGHASQLEILRRLNGTYTTDVERNTVFRKLMIALYSYLRVDHFNLRRMARCTVRHIIHRDWRFCNPLSLMHHRPPCSFSVRRLLIRGEYGAIWCHWRVDVNTVL